jgi:hypothetical protein
MKYYWLNVRWAVWNLVESVWLFVCHLSNHRMCSGYVLGYQITNFLGNKVSDLQDEINKEG